MSAWKCSIIKVRSRVSSSPTLSPNQGEGMGHPPPLLIALHLKPHRDRYPVAQWNDRRVPIRRRIQQPVQLDDTFRVVVRLRFGQIGIAGRVGDAPAPQRVVDE